MQNINLLNLSECYGCSACVSACSQKAIAFCVNDEGFFYPIVDESKCINCGLCLKVCNIDRTNLDSTLNAVSTQVYAAWCKNHNDVIKSTSGGIATLLAHNFVERGGVVYGAAFDEDLVVNHLRVDSVSDVEKLRGSKYSQSNILGIFQQIKSDLQEDKSILFIGTPCQVGGLKSFLRKSYDGLYTIDLVCHGVPSPKMFTSYIEYIEDVEGCKVSEYYFRKKKKSGWRAYEGVVFQNGKRVVRNSGTQSFSVGFYNSYFSRESCYSCGYSQKQRSGDITLSDFWGAEKAHKELRLQRKYGFNFLGINSQKGREMLSNIQSQIESVESSIDVAASGDLRFVKSDDRPVVRDVIYKLLNESGYRYLADNFLTAPGKVRTLLFPNWIKNIIREIQNRI